MVNIMKITTQQKIRLERLFQNRENLNSEETKEYRELENLDFRSKYFIDGKCVAEMTTEELLKYGFKVD